MRAPAGALRRSVALATAATLGGAAALGLAVAPAAAAVGAPTNLMTADRPCAAASPGPYLSPDRLN
ncbi:MAG TPA: hypothetical protein VNV66_11040, partial [Pilimelia sp.]|nr:hypothetical protein [Pilimelia sp.]